jgi:predicted regulator of Ras-like GTPase activity (Roadblock/LC7/MglB family)
MYMANSTGTTSSLWQTIPDNQLVRLLDRSHTLNGAVLVGLDGLTIEIQARAMNVDEDGLPWRKAVKISGMAKGAT